MRYLCSFLAPLLLAVSTNAVAAGRAAVRIGGTLPLTGPEGGNGIDFRQGYDLAAEQVNEGGGLAVDGTRLPVRVVVRDDASDPRKAEALAQEMLAADQVDFFLGTFSTGLVQAQAAAAERAGVPYVAGSGAATGLFAKKQRFLFGLQSPVKLLAETQMDWIAEQQKAGLLPTPARIALVRENNAHGDDFRAGVMRSIERHPEAWKLVLDEPFEINAKKFGPLVARVKAAGADVFLADAHLADYIDLHREYLAQGLCHAVVSYGARGAEREAAAALGPKNVQDILSAVWWDPQLGGAGPNRVFVEQFQAKYGRTPRWQNALGYEAARALLTAIASAGTTNREAVRSALASLRMESILPVGTLTFPAALGQQAHYPFVVLQNQAGGKSPVIYPPYLATGRGVVHRCAAVR